METSALSFPDAKEPIRSSDLYLTGRLDSVHVYLCSNGRLRTDEFGYVDELTGLADNYNERIINDTGMSPSEFEAYWMRQLRLWIDNNSLDKLKLICLNLLWVERRMRWVREHRKPHPVEVGRYVDEIPFCEFNDYKRDDICETRLFNTIRGRKSANVETLRWFWFIIRYSEIEPKDNEPHPELKELTMSGYSYTDIIRAECHQTSPATTSALIRARQTIMNWNR